MNHNCVPRLTIRKSHLYALTERKRGRGNIKEGGPGLTEAGTLPISVLGKREAEIKQPKGEEIKREDR